MSLHTRLPLIRGFFSRADRKSARLSAVLLAAAAASPALHAQIKVMTNGDSITFGVGVSDTNTQSYTAQLGRMLGNAYYTQKDGTGGATLLKNGTVPFWNTQGIRITSEMKPNIIYIMLGTNDSKPVNWVYKDQYIPDYLSLVDIYRGLSSNPQIYLGLPPPATASAGDVNGPTVANEVIPKILEVARQRNLKVVDAHSPFLDPFRSVIPDGIHPNDTGAGLIATQIYNAIVHGKVWNPTPSQWQRSEIGATGYVGADALDDSNVFQVIGGGVSALGNTDAGHFVHQTMNGDVELTARALGQRNLDPLVATRADSSAGVTIREGTGADARQVSVLATPGAGVSFRWRDANGAALGATTVNGVNPPVWVRVRRSGNTFAGYYSTDGSSWSQIGSSRSIAMNMATRAGLVANSGLPATLTHARLERVQLAGTITGTIPDSGTGTGGGSTGGTGGTGSTGGGSGGSTTSPTAVTTGFDTSASASRTITSNAFAALAYPAQSAWRFTSDVAANRPALGVLGTSTREAAGFDGARTMVGPRSQDIFTPDVSQDLGFVGLVRIPATGGSGKGLLLCINKNDVEPAVGVGYDYGSNRFYAVYSQALNGAPSEITGPVSARGSTYVVRLQKTGGVVRLRIDGALAAETNTARPAILTAGQGAAITLGGLRPLNPQFVGQLGKFHLRNGTLSDTEAATLETALRTWLGSTSTDTGTGTGGTGGTGGSGSTGGTGSTGTVANAGLDPAATASRTIVSNAFAALSDPAQSAWRFSSDVAANRPTLGLFPSTTREAAGFDGARTMVGPRSQDIFAPGVSQDMGFVGAVRIPSSGGSGKALILCVNKSDVEAALGVGYDYGSNRFFLAYTQAFNGAPSEVTGPVVNRNATYVLRVQKSGGTIKLFVDGVLAAQTATARAAILASGQGAPITLGGLRPLNPQFVGQLGKFYLRSGTVSDAEALALENDVETWLGN